MMIFVRDRGENDESPQFSKKVKSFIYLACGFITLMICLYGFVLLKLRPGVPQEINKQNLLQIDGIKIGKDKDIEFLMSKKRPGDLATFLLEVEGKIEKKEARLIPFYSQLLFPTIYLIIGLFCLAFGFLVFILRSEEEKAHIFYWTALAFSSSLIISGGFHCLRGEILSYLPGILFYIFYPLAPALILHFSLSFSRNITRVSKVFIYFPAFLFALALEATFLGSSLKSSVEIYRVYQSIFYVFRFYVVGFVVLAFLCLLFGLRKALLDESRAQIKWILYGIFAGLGPFIVLYQLPLVLRIYPLISEEFSSIFFIVIPIAFAISIVKFRLMNIELIINKSLVYGALTVFTVSLYLFSLSVFQKIFSKFLHVQEDAISAVAALGAAVAFNPARRKIQEFVDKSFYRSSYDYRKTLLDFNEKAQKMVKRDYLIDFFLAKVKNALPLERIAVSVYSTVSGKPRTLIKRGADIEVDSIVLGSLKGNHIVARKRAVSTEENMDFSKENLLEKHGLELIIPLSLGSPILTGYLTAGKKLSGERFSRDDLELMLTMAGELALNLERIRLQEEVFYERAEKEKFDELSRLKTEFISTVSHEIRTPMSSIRGLTEILQEGKVKNKEKQKKILNLLASESSRLSRFLHNILDLGKIEQDVKTYNFQMIKVQPVIQDVVKLFGYRLEQDGFLLTLHLPKNPLVLRVDQDALKQALTNLIDNAIKYSSGRREIDVELIEMEKQIEIQVTDKGIGIPLNDQEKIFEKFYRHRKASQYDPRGVGLGLKIVKHIMGAHKGEIRVKSCPDKGSTFSLIFPKP